MSYFPRNPNGQATSANSEPVVIASNQTAIPITVASLPIPTGASTSAKQDLLLEELKLKADLTETQPVSVGNFPANQAVTGTFFQATQPVSNASLPLPTGAATSANQQTNAITDAQLRATPLPIVGTRSNAGTTLTTGANHVTIGGSDGTNLRPLLLDPTGRAIVSSSFGASIIPTATTMQNAVVAVGNGTNLNVQGYVSVILNITGTFIGTITFEASVDDITFVAITAHQVGVAGNLSITTTTSGDFRISTAAYKSIRARISSYTSGSITVKGYASAVAGHPTTVSANLRTATKGTTTAGDVTSTNINANKQALDVSIVSDVALLKTLFNERITAEKSIIFSCPPYYGLSTYRDYSIVTGAATIAEVDGEFNISTTANGADSYSLETVQTTLYISGKQVQASVGLRIPTLPTGNQTIHWGVFNTENGFYFGVDATSFFVAIRRKGVDTIVRQSAWNLDVLNGTGLSGINLATCLNDGVIWSIDYAWYGYSGIAFGVNICNDLGNTFVPVHFLKPATGGASIPNPEVPMTVRIANNGTATARSVFVTGRKYEVYGYKNTNNRFTNEVRLNVSTVSGVIAPLLAFRRKTTFRGRENGVNAHPYSFSINSTNRTHYIQLIMDDAGLITQTFGVPSGTPTAETGLETAVNSMIYMPSLNAVTIWRDVVAAGASTLRVTELLPRDSLMFNIPKGKEIILTATPLGGNGTIDAVTMTFKELW